MSEFKKLKDGLMHLAEMAAHEDPDTKLEEFIFFEGAKAISDLEARLAKSEKRLKKVHDALCNIIGKIENISFNDETQDAIDEAKFLTIMLLAKIRWD